MTILVIDDNDTLRDSISRFLCSLGHDVIQASDGKEGLARLSNSTFDLIITDIHMPEKDGIELIVHLGKRSNAVHPPIIAMTAGDAHGFNYLEEAKLFGAERVLLKPFSMDELKNVIEEIH